MKKSLIMTIVVIACVVSFGWFAAQAAPQKGAGPVMPNCPVMGEKVDLACSTTTADGPVYFCCAKCIDKYKANPAKFADSVKTQREVLAKLPKTQVACPISGKPYDKDASVSEAGQKVYFCCKKCAGMYQKDSGKYKGKLATAYTYQTKCPVSDEPIDPKASMTLKNGFKIYFCCPKCMKAFEKDPAKYTPKLAAQGYDIDGEECKKKDAESGHSKGK